jgi:hypothetical protein
VYPISAVSIFSKIAAQGASLVSLPPMANVKNLQSEKFHYFVGTPFKYFFEI